MNPKKEDTEPDQPRRIWASTVARINAHLAKANKIIGKKKGEVVPKKTFNTFLLDALNAYDLINESEVHYATVLHTDLATARGEAIVKAVKASETPKMPYKVVIVGQDEL